MAQINFTDRWLRNVSASGAQAEFSDVACPNLRLRVGKRTKTFSVMIGPAGSRRRVTLGKYPTLSLAEARQKASLTTDNPFAATVAKKEARFGTVRDLFEYAVQSMAAEGKATEANRIYLLEGPLAAINHFGEATLARNNPPGQSGSRYVEAPARLAFHKKQSHGYIKPGCVIGVSSLTSNRYGCSS